MSILRSLLAFSTPALLFSVTPVYAQSPGGPGNPGKTIDTLSSPAASPIAFAASPFNSLPLTPSSAPAAADPLFELPSLPLIFAQSGDEYDEWRGRMDAARSKRLRGMLLTAGGFLGGSLIAATVITASPGDTGVDAGLLINLVGAGVGSWGVFQWIVGHSEIGELELEGSREGYVSITPVPGGVAGTLALSF